MPFIEMLAFISSLLRTSLFESDETCFLYNIKIQVVLSELDLALFKPFRDVLSDH